MDSAMGLMVAQTTALGRIVDISVHRVNQNRSWLRKELPTSPRKRAAMRLSRPVSSQDTEMMDAPSSSKMISDA